MHQTQFEVKTVRCFEHILKWSLKRRNEKIYMHFIAENKKHKVCKLNKAIRGLKQIARQWFNKIDDVIKTNTIDRNTINVFITLTRKIG